MSETKTIDVSQLIDDQPIRRFHVALVAMVFLIILADGYDLQAMGFAAPGIVNSLHIKQSLLGPVFSASLLGMLFGAPLFGWIGDRFGRRRALLWCVTLIGLFSLLIPVAQDLSQLLVLRLLTGVAMGGLPPSCVALVAEYAPKRMRATMIVIAMTGLTIGSMLPAMASGFLEGAHGWRPIFIIGGVFPLVVAAVALFALPESLKFMVVKKWPANKIWQVARALDPRLRTEAEATLVIAEPPIRGAEGAGINSLFSNGLVWITPILWLLYITFYAANNFMHSWMPLVFRNEGLTIVQTAVAAAMFDVGGVIGALVASRLVDKFGVAGVVCLYVVVCPTMGLIGVIVNSVYLLSAAIFVTGFCLIGITLSMNAIAGEIYPTSMRAKGVGWASGIGRLGSIISPMIGGWLIAMQTPVSQLFLAPVVPMIFGTVACFMLMRLCTHRFGGPRLIAA
jgi:AAHS family 4-hydroxybenzoate transporter-like MFS transporter